MPTPVRPQDDTDSEVIHDLPSKARAVLAVLVLGALWPERFDGGWVSLEKLRSYGDGLEYKGKDETATKTIRRGIKEIRAISDAPKIEEEGVRTVSGQEAAVRRLRQPLSMRLQRWFFAEGLGYLAEEVRREFQLTQHRPIQSLAEILSTLEESVVRMLLSQGKYGEAIARAENAIRNSPTKRDARSLELAHATALMIRDGDKDRETAEDILVRLVKSTTTMLSHSDRVTDARIRLALAHCLLRHLQDREPGVAGSAAESIRSLVDEANEISTDLSLTDRGQIMNIAGLLLSWEAQIDSDVNRRSSTFDEAEWYLRQTLAICRLAHDSYSLKETVFNLGALLYSRHDLSRGVASEEEIRQVLAWFEASVAYTKSLGLARDWVVDYARAAECHVRLVPHLARAGDVEGCRQALDRARDYLVRARRHVRALRTQRDLVDWVESLAEEMRRDHLDSASHP